MGWTPVQLKGNDRRIIISPNNGKVYESFSDLEEAKALANKGEIRIASWNDINKIDGTVGRAAVPAILSLVAAQRYCSDL